MQRGIRPNRIGFTLIELLVVVGIIAILAAIAIPNFLEAQTRAKVARVKIEMKIVVNALQQYRMDNNRYITEGAGLPNPIHGHTTYLPPFTVLTTPISYLTTIPEDIFAVDGMHSPFNRSVSKSYQIPFESGNFVRPFPFQYHTRYNRFGEKIPVGQPIGMWMDAYENAGELMFSLTSWGPDRLLYGTPSLPWGVAYDPSNGTVSMGDITFLGPNFGFSGVTREVIYLPR